MELTRLALLTRLDRLTGGLLTRLDRRYHVLNNCTVTEFVLDGHAGTAVRTRVDAP
jgi:hypothetical protein